MNKVITWSGIVLFALANTAWATSQRSDFSVQNLSNNQPHLPDPSSQFEEGRDYFTYQEPVGHHPRADHKVRIQFFFDYDCRVCSSAEDILELYTQMRPNKVSLEEYPVATAESQFTAKVFYTLKALKADDLSSALLFETSEKARYAELSSPNKMLKWAEGQGFDKQLFSQTENSKEVKQQVKDAIELTEEYGVFTYPYVVIGGKYVLTASTLYNDDYSVAVLDFLVNKLERERRE